MVFHVSFLANVKYLVCFTMLLEEGSGGESKKVVSSIGCKDGSEIGLQGVISFFVEGYDVVVLPKFGIWQVWW